MADEQAHQASHDDDELTPGYKAPAQKSLEEIKNQDQDDEALRKYKETLLGAAEVKPVFPDNPKRVIVTKLAFCPVGREDMEVDLSNLEEAKKTLIIVKEGCKYKMKVYFYIQHDIVSGLRYTQQIYRKGIRVDKDNYMVGSYSPQATPHIYTSPEDEAPSGLMSRGSYKVKSCFSDDDKNKHLEWEWKLDIKSDWA